MEEISVRCENRMKPVMHSVVKILISEGENKLYTLHATVHDVEEDSTAVELLG